MGPQCRFARPSLVLGRVGIPSSATVVIPHLTRSTFSHRLSNVAAELFETKHKHKISKICNSTPQRNGAHLDGVQQPPQPLLFSHAIEAPFKVTGVVSHSPPFRQRFVTYAHVSRFPLRFPLATLSHVSPAESVLNASHGQKGTY